MSDLRRIPGIGREMEQHLLRLGYPTVASLRGADPEAMYAEDCALHGGVLDRCVLYVYRCAVYYAETDTPDPDKCRWWAWKD